MPFTTSLTPDEQKKAKKELNEKKEWRDRDISTLKDLVVAHKGRYHFINHLLLFDKGMGSYTYLVPCGSLPHIKPR